jgi:hypothetical protein
MFIVRHLLSHGASWRTTYLQGIDTEEIISTVHARHAPVISASAGLIAKVWMQCRQAAHTARLAIRA